MLEVPEESAGTLEVILNPVELVLLNEPSPLRELPTGLVLVRARCSSSLILGRHTELMGALF